MMGKAARKMQRGTRSAPFRLEHADLESIKTALSVHMDIAPQDCTGAAFADLWALMESPAGKTLKLMTPAHYQVLYGTLLNLHIRLDTGLAVTDPPEQNAHVAAEALRLCTWVAQRRRMTDEQFQAELVHYRASAMQALAEMDVEGERGEA